MAEGFFGPLPDGRNADAESVTTSAGTVWRERDRLAGAGAQELVDVKNADPAPTLYGAVVRPIPLSSVTASAPAQVVVGTTPIQLLPANPNRKRFTLQNTGLTRHRIVLGTIAPTQTAYHFGLRECGTPDDDSSPLYVDDMWKGAVQVISSAAGGTIVMTEFT